MSKKDSSEGEEFAKHVAAHVAGGLILKGLLVLGTGGALAPILLMP